MLGLLQLTAKRAPLSVWVEVLRGLRREPTGERPDAIAARIERWSRRFRLEGGCYPEALASCALLVWHGHDPVLVLGVRHRPFEAHAWVEVAGSALTGGAEAPRFTPLTRIPL